MYILARAASAVSTFVPRPVIDNRQWWAVRVTTLGPIAAWTVEQSGAAERDKRVTVLLQLRQPDMAYSQEASASWQHKLALLRLENQRRRTQLLKARMGEEQSNVVPPAFPSSFSTPPAPLAPGMRPPAGLPPAFMSNPAVHSDPTVRAALERLQREKERNHAKVDELRQVQAADGRGRGDKSGQGGIGGGGGGGGGNSPGHRHGYGIRAPGARGVHRSRFAEDMLARHMRETDGHDPSWGELRKVTQSAGAFQGPRRRQEQRGPEAPLSFGAPSATQPQAAELPEGRRDRERTANYNVPPQHQPAPGPLMEKMMVDMMSKLQGTSNDRLELRGGGMRGHLCMSV
jgi:hypothetical protein